MTSKHVAPSIAPERWQYLKGLGLSGGRYIHISADVRMIPSSDGLSPPRPWIQSPGVTYNIGSNAAKRARKK